MDNDLRRRHVIAKWIRVGRAEKGWTVDQLAQAAEMSRPGVSDIANKNTDAKPESLKKISAALGKPIPKTREDGMDPVREVQARRAAETLIGAAKGADRLLDSGRLDAAEQTLWRGIRAAESELRGEGIEGPAQEGDPTPDVIELLDEIDQVGEEG